MGFLSSLAGAITSPIATLASGALGAYSAKSTNQAAAGMTQKQMDFQERMSSTAHQRQVKDMRLAGLNPILSATGGSGASSPAGGAAPVIDVASTATKSISSALQTKRLSQELNNLLATEDLIKEQKKQIQYGEPGKRLGTLAVEQLLGNVSSAKDVEYVVQKDRGKITEIQKKLDNNLIDYGKGRYGYKPGYGKSFQ